MAWPVKAVEMTARAMMAGTNTATRCSPNAPSGNSESPIST
jgi:hypothetical protein